MRSMPNAQLILTAYTLYDMIKEQFDKNNFYQISMEMIKYNEDDQIVPWRERGIAYSKDR